MTSENMQLRDTTAKWIQTENWGIHYHEMGRGDPVILLHGSAPGSSGWVNFADNIASLASEFRVMALDIPGWGRSNAAPPGRADSVGALTEFIDALGIDRASLVGNSMGAMIAMSFAARHPDRVAHLVTMGAPALFGANALAPGGPSEGLKHLVRAYQDPSLPTLKSMYEVMVFNPVHVTAEAVEQRRDAAIARPELLSDFLDGFGKPGYMPTPTAEEVAQISAPTLLIHGRDDRVIHFENALKLCATIANSRVHLINRCGHLAQIEHVDEVNALISYFLRTAPAPAPLDIDPH
ncbi:alpha/beta fold hydrolase [Dietzia maris]|uniref:alpha/beta fold hydrolase n=1 Tax=Dietzia maris TaxID=37915 RepID=UPI00223BCD08|nr:alpha/beta fold hydrolase [Dietzia maris]MCT1433497.1 alpha/beta fold hydrolase [Dietzia maris]MCT1520567.1 alpha/beta fold hydrolase [Dietzia maris]